jgi:hypothetical protein
MTRSGPLLPSITRDAITRQDDRLPPELLLGASRREVHGLSYWLVATVLAAVAAADLLVVLLIVGYFFAR